MRRCFEGEERDFALPPRGAHLTRRKHRKLSENLVLRAQIARVAERAATCESATRFIIASAFDNCLVGHRGYSGLASTIGPLA